LDLNQEIIETISNFVIELLTNNELQMARLLRKKLINRIIDKKNKNFDQTLFNDDSKFENSKSLVLPYLNTFYR
jgi:hypothetical protein